MTDERWLPVVGYEEKYLISDQGRVWSMKNGIYLKPYKRYGGKNHTKVYLAVALGGRNRRVHHLMLEAFVGPRPDGMEACHENDIGTDNRIENLRWDTHSANRFDCVRNGTDAMASKTECVKGHRYTDANTTLIKRLDGTVRQRRCKTCNTDHHKKWLEKNPEYMNAWYQKQKAMKGVGR